MKAKIETAWRLGRAQVGLVTAERLFRLASILDGQHVAKCNGWEISKRSATTAKRLFGELSEAVGEVGATLHEQDDPRGCPLWLHLPDKTVIYIAQ